MKACLIVIDLQNDFLERIKPTARRSLLDNTNKLIAAVRQNAQKVIWVHQSFKRDLSDAFLEMRDNQISVVVEGTKGAELADGLDVRPSDAKILKKRYSAFFNTGLDDILAAEPPEFLVMAGLNTHACIRMSAIDAYQRDYRVVLAEACIGSPQTEHADVSLAYLKNKIARILPNDEIVRLIR